MMRDITKSYKQKPMITRGGDQEEVLLTEFRIAGGIEHNPSNITYIALEK